ncbi:MAG TPA: hypothetical protein VLK85_28800 [Ramlibacter sp.]|nr:hypothetical protein [Ramlibacter sp.]
MQYRSLFWEDVQVGQSLPPLNYELSLLRLVSFVRATGLYDYVHFDGSYARSAGARDAFISAPHIAGLFSRLVTDWTGPLGELRSLKTRIQAQCCVGDMLAFAARVGRKYVTADGDHMVELVDMNASHALAPSAACASATIRLPSRSGARATGDALAPPEVDVLTDPPAPEEIRALIGVETEIKFGQGRPVSEAELHLWCECLEDWNPVYWNHEYARASHWGGLIVPPAGRFFGVGSGTSMGVGYLKPGSTTPEVLKRNVQGHALMRELREGMIRSNTPFALPGYSEVAVVSSETHYVHWLRPGESTRTYAQIRGCSGLKKTKLGDGHFLTWTESVRSVQGELKTMSTLTALFYSAHTP